MHDLDGGRFTSVVHVLLVGDAEHQYPAAFEGLAPLVERRDGLVHHPLRHAAVDLARQADEAGIHTVFQRLPGEIEGIYEDAATTETGARVIGYEAERLGGGGVDDLVDV